MEKQEHLLGSAQSKWFSKKPAIAFVLVTMMLLLAGRIETSGQSAQVKASPEPVAAKSPAPKPEGSSIAAEAAAAPQGVIAVLPANGALLTPNLEKKSSIMFGKIDTSDLLGKRFAEGMNLSPSLTVPSQSFGQNGTQTFGFTITTQKGTNLRDNPQVILPPQQQRIGTRRGALNLNYAYEQYFYQDADMFTFGLSDALRDALFDIKGERDVDASYNYAVTPWPRTTAEVEAVLTATRRNQNRKIYFGRPKLSY